MSQSVELPTRRSLSISESVMKRVGMFFNKMSYGEACPDFTEEMIRVLGVGGFFAWVKHAGSSLEALKERFGDVDSQLLTGIVAMWNGCTYCGKGHALAANVHYFKETGQLLPFDEGVVYWLQRQKDGVILEHLREAFAGEEHQRRLALINRLIEIKSGEDGEPTEDDPWLEAINGAWDWATECSITLQIVDVPALDPVGKDRAAVARYHEARAAWRKERGEHPGYEPGLGPWQKTG